MNHPQQNENLFMNELTVMNLAALKVILSCQIMLATMLTLFLNNTFKYTFLTGNTYLQYLHVMQMDLYTNQRMAMTC